MTKMCDGAAGNQPCPHPHKCTVSCQFNDAELESQEPVAWIERDMQCDDFDPDSVTCEKPTIAADGWEWVALYTHPPQRT